MKISRSMMLFATAALPAAAFADSAITPGATVSTTVKGTTSIYAIFGQVGDPAGEYPGTAETPAVLVSFAADPGNVFTFSASGLVSCCSDAPNFGPDGGGGGTSINPLNGLSGLSGNTHIPLVGVFTTDAKPTGAPPASLPFNANSPASLAPALNQVFYIGDGKGGLNNPAGTPLTFSAPAGATRLYLGVVDGWSFYGTSGWYGDNHRQFDVRVSLAPVPETYAMMLAGLGNLGSVARRRKSR